jgi:hypothetical protein
MTYNKILEFMITCANGTSAQDLAGDRVKLMSNIPAAVSSPLSTPKSLQVLLEKRLYIIPLLQCDTWFVSFQASGFLNVHILSLKPEIYSKLFKIHVGITRPIYDKLEGDQDYSRVMANSYFSIRKGMDLSKSF